MYIVYSERKVVQFQFKSTALLKLHILSMLPVTSAIQSDILSDTLVSTSSRCIH